MTNFFRSHLPYRKQRPWHSFVILSRIKTEPSQPSYAKLPDKGHLYPMNYNQKCVIQLYCYVKYDLMSFMTLVSFFTASFSLSSITANPNPKPTTTVDMTSLRLFVRSFSGCELLVSR